MGKLKGHAISNLFSNGQEINNICLCINIDIDRDMIEQICMMLNIMLIIFLMTRQGRKIKVETTARLIPQTTR